MSQRLNLPWQQLWHEKMKLLAAVAGILVSVVLMWMQLGLMQSLFASAVVFHKSLDGDLIVIHRQYEHLLHSRQFSSRLLYRLSGSAAVQQVSALYLSASEWKNPWNGEMRAIQCYGVETDRLPMRLPGLTAQAAALRQTDAFLFDSRSRPRFGEVLRSLQQGGDVELEINRRRMSLAGLTELGASFGVDGNIIVSHANFLRLFPQRQSGAVDVGVVRLRSGADATAAQREFQDFLGREVLVLTPEEFVHLELSYWRTATPIGIVFSTGTIVGFLIGFIVVYQILYTDVTNHLPQFATLKAMGFSNGYLYRLVMSQSLYLALLGYIPGSLLAGVLYAGLRAVTQLPLQLTWWRGIGLLAATVAMCLFSGLLAIRRLSAADPADVF